MLYPIATTSRSTHVLDGIWNFCRELEEIDYSQGFAPEKQTAVPSSYNDLYVEEEFRLPAASVWYSREFRLPLLLEKERLVLRFGAVNYHATVYLNGTLLGEHKTGYTPFEFEITSLVNFRKENFLSVRVASHLSCETMPMGNLSNPAEPGQIGGQYPDTPFDFFNYAGIHRPVLIYSTNRTAWLERVRIATKEIQEAGATISISGNFAGECATIRLSVGDNTVIANCQGESGKFHATLFIPKARLWDVFEPNLYSLCIQLLDRSGELIDEYSERFGIRTVRVDGQRLLLNDKPVYLQGFGRHEDFPVIGRGLNNALNIRDHELLKWINANSYRTSHYPYSEEMVRLADEQGFLVIGETPGVSVNLDHVNGQTLQTHKQTLRELIERDFNNPSIIMWSVANEATSDRAAAKSYFEELANLTRSLDDTRPVTIVTCKPLEDVTLDSFDIVSLNTYPGWYWLPGQIDKACEDLKLTLDRLHEKTGKPIFIAEFGADAIAGFHALPAEQWSEEFQADLITSLLSTIRTRDFVIGEHIWNFADFRTAQNFTRPGGNKKGVFTRERQPKMAARSIKQFWAKKRVVSDEA